MNNFRLLARIIIALLVIVFVFWMVEQNISFSGEKKIEYGFNGEPNAIIGFWPGQLHVENEANGKIAVSSDNTVYFDVKTPVLYRSVEILIDGGGLRDAQIGVRIPPDNWTYRKVVLDENNHANISLEGASRTNNKYTFAIIGSDSDSFRLSKMTLVLERDRMSVCEALDKIKNIWNR